MIFSKRNKNINPIYLNTNNNVIEHVHQFNFLGLHLISRLTWNTHIEHKNISRTIGVLKKLQLAVPENILLSIQCTYSHTDKLLFAMLGLQFFCDISLAKEASRIISGANIKSHTEPIFKLYSLLKIENI